MNIEIPLTWLPILLPVSLLCIKFFLKLAVDRVTDIPSFVQALLALPVDIVFLAASFLAGHAIFAAGRDQPYGQLGLTYFVFCLGFSVLNVLFWRKSETFFNRSAYWRTSIIAFANFAVSVAILICSLAVFSPKVG